MSRRPQQWLSLAFIFACWAATAASGRHFVVAAGGTKGLQNAFKSRISVFRAPHGTRQETGAVRRQLWGRNTEPIIYNGGEVMTSPVSVTMIYIGFNSTDALPNWLNHFTSNVDSTNFWRTTKKYYKVTKDNKKVYVNGTLKLKDSWYFPATFQRDYGITTDLDKKGYTFENEMSSVVQLVSKALLIKKPRMTKDDIYVLVTADGVIKRPACDEEEALGWHYSYPISMADGSQLMTKMVFIPQDRCFPFSAPGDKPGTLVRRNKVAPMGYEPSKSPSGSGFIDQMITTLAHELIEAVTDPEVYEFNATGWFGGNVENADSCAHWYRYPLRQGMTRTGKILQYTDLVGGRPMILPLTFDPTVDPKTKQQVGCVFGTNADNEPLLTFIGGNIAPSTEDNISSS